MAKCGCAGSSCSCLVTPGNGVLVSGTGNSSDPYVIGLSGTAVLLTQATAGSLDISAYAGSIVQVTMTANITSLILSTVPGATYDLIIYRPSGSATITWSGVLWPGGAAPALSTVPTRDWFRLRAISATQYVGTRIGADVR